MAKRKLYSECAGGEVTVTVEPHPSAPSDRYGKPAYKIRVAKRGMKTWSPKDPLYSFLPMSRPNTKENRRRREEGQGGETLFDDAIGFFDYYRCGEGRGEGVGGLGRLKKRRHARRRGGR